MIFSFEAGWLTNLTLRYHQGAVGAVSWMRTRID